MTDAPFCPLIIDQARVPATSAALRALCVTADELAAALLAAHRLTQLPAVLGLAGGVEGAVFAVKDWGTGGVRLRVVEGVEAPGTTAALPSARTQDEILSACLAASSHHPSSRMRDGLRLLYANMFHYCVQYE